LIEKESTMTIRERVIEIIAERIGVAKEELTDEASLSMDLGADSLGIIMLVMDIEEKFDIMIPDKDAEELRTVGQYVSYVEAHVRTI